MNKVGIDKEVVIIGGIHHNTLGVIRALGEAGVDRRLLSVVLVDTNPNQNDYIFRSKYVDKGNITYLNFDSGIFPYLKRKAEDKKERIIICCSDASAEIVLKNSHDLKYYSSPTANDFILDLFDKQKQSNFAAMFGFNVPKSCVFESKQNCVTWDIFPCIIKPIKSICGAGKKDIRIVWNRQQLDKELKDIVSPKIQIQEFIEKEFEYQLIGCSLESGQKVIIPGYTNILRQASNTNTGYLYYSSVDELGINMDQIKSFLQKIGYNGLFSMEFIRDKNGKDYYLETNFRNDGNSYCVKSAGVNLPYIWTDYCGSKRVPLDEEQHLKNNVHFIPDLEDLKLGIRTVGVIEWVREFLESESHSVYNTRDMSPFISQIIKRIKRKFAKLKINEKPHDFLHL